MFKIIGEVSNNGLLWNIRTHTKRYIRKQDIQYVNEISSPEDYTILMRDLLNRRKEGDFYPIEMRNELRRISLNTIDCKCPDLDGQYYHCSCDYGPWFPIYILTTEDKSKYCLHPDEREHMERFLAGTDNPIYDLVHELRFNPLFGLDKDIRKAKEEDKKRKLSF